MRTVGGSELSKPRSQNGDLGHPILGLVLLLLLGLVGCRGGQREVAEVVVAVENSPSSLDPRVGTDASSERIDMLLFDSLVRKDEHFRMVPWLATSWEQPDALTWVFHLRDGVRFADGRPLEAEDVAWTIRSTMDAGVAGLTTSKGGNFASVAEVDVPDRLTLRIRLKRVDASLLFNLSDGMFGVVPRGAGKEFAQAPVGSGTFRFVSQETDKDVVVARNDRSWSGLARLPRVRFAVVPDAVTVALELEKGSVDVASNVLSPDLVHALAGRGNLATEAGQSSRVMYLNFNCVGQVGHTPGNPLGDVRVRQAVAYAMDRPAIVAAAYRGHATLANTLLPAGHWAAAKLAGYPHDAGRAAALLEEAGYRAGKDGVRVRLEMKTSQDETTRLLGEILQQQLAEAGIALTLRATEFGTFYSDVTAGRFEIYALAWVGSNEDPDIFRYAYGSDRMPPKGANRGHYANAEVDRLLGAAGGTNDETVRRAAYVDVQKTLLAEVPGVMLWYPENEVVHARRLIGVTAPASGSFDFLRSAWVR